MTQGQNQITRNLKMLESNTIISTLKSKLIPHILNIVIVKVHLPGTTRRKLSNGKVTIFTGGTNESNFTNIEIKLMINDTK